jgi:hypothetical protein
MHEPHNLGSRFKLIINYTFSVTAWRKHGETLFGNWTKPGEARISSERDQLSMWTIRTAVLMRRQVVGGGQNMPPPCARVLGQWGRAQTRLQGFSTSAE